MADDKKVLKMTQREQDIMKVMIKEANTTLGSDEIKRTRLAPSDIRDNLKEKYPDITRDHVVSSQKNLEHLGLIVKIPNAGDGKLVSGALPPTTFDIREEVYNACEVETITKRKTGYAKGTHKKPPVTIDKTKTVLKRARELVEKKKIKLDLRGKQGMALRKKLAKNDEEVASLREDIRVIADLLAIKNKNLRRVGLIK